VLGGLDHASESHAAQRQVGLALCVILCNAQAPQANSGAVSVVSGHPQPDQYSAAAH
jgi:ABC-type sulfate transport system permease subunit